MRSTLALGLLVCVGSLAGSSGAATGAPAAQALAHLQGFDESLANLQVDLSAPVVVSTPAQTRQRLNGLNSLIVATLSLIQKGFPGSSALMVQQAKSIDQELATIAQTQGAALLRGLATIKVSEGSLEAAIKTAAAVPASTATQTTTTADAGGSSGSAKVVVKTGGSPTPLAPGTPLLFPERTSLSSFATAGERVQALQLINVGTAPATIGAVAVTGPDTGDFIVSPGCDNATLAPGSGACFISVEVRAARYKRPLNASLVVTGTQTGGVGPITLGLTQADLTLSALLATPAKGRLTYRFGLTNGGPAPAERTELDAKVTASAGSLKLVSSAPAGCTYGSETGILACPLGTLPAHARTALTVVFQVPKTGGRVTNLATVQSLDFDPTSGNNTKRLVTALK